MKKWCIMLAFMLALLTVLPAENISAADISEKSQCTKFTNYDYTFTSIDGSEVSTKSNGEKATVLIFGGTTCFNSHMTLASVAKCDWITSDDIRVIFAECQGAELEELEEFAESCGGREYIEYCYGAGINNAVFRYLNAGYGSISSVTMPVIVFIDAQNQVQNIMTDNHSAGELITEMKKFADLPYEGVADPVLTLSINGTENYAYAAKILELVNQTRNEQGKPALSLDGELTEAAMQRAAEISLYYSHTRPDGRSCFTVLRRGSSYAENIAAGQASPQAVMESWVNSSGHYANIISDYVTSIGIGCFQDGNGMWYWVQYFDNAAAVPLTESGEKQTTRTVLIKESMLQLINGSGKEQQIFSCADTERTTEMKISNKNYGWSYSRPELPSSCFTFESSNPTVATVNDTGTITINAVGTAVITAKMKEAPSLSVTLKITKQAHQYNSVKVEPTTQTQGYTLHTCTGCGDSYKDTYVPMLKPDTQKEDSASKSQQVSLKVANVSGMKTTSEKKSVKISWKKTVNASGYYVYRYDSTKKSWKKIATVGSSKTSYTVKSLASGSTYRFAVKAYRKQNGKTVTSKSYTSAYVATKPETVKFSVAAGKKKATLRWSKVKGVTGYTVYYKTTENGKWKKLKDTKKTSCTKTKLKSGKKYYFTVKAYKTHKGKTYTGSGSTKSVKIK